MILTKEALAFFAAAGTEPADNPNQWRAFALCSQLGPEASDQLFYSRNMHVQQRAREFCAACPVIEQCRDFARENRIYYGMYGGETGTQRGIDRHEYVSWAVEHEDAIEPQAA